MHPLWFFIDAWVVAVSAWLVGRTVRQESGGLIEVLITWGICACLVVVGTGVFSGTAGWFSPEGFLGLHVGILVVMAALRWRNLRDDGREFRAMGAGVMLCLKKDQATRHAALALTIFLVITLFLAATGEPGIYDALTYRLSRIGHWLQEERIGFMVTNDPRQNYMPVVPDVAMAWLLGSATDGYGLVALAQWAGGVLLLAATVGLARRAGVGRAPALGAALLVAGFANVAPQFTTAHTDLLTSGLVASAFFLWREAAQRRRGSIIAGLAGGLALGAKGTVFYFLPALAVWALWYGWQYRLPVSAWGRTVLAGVAGTLIFAAPGLVQNWRHYGGIFGPSEFVTMHHQGGGGHWLAKTAMNLQSSFIQLLEPHSQMPGVDCVAKAVALRLATRQPEADPFAFENASRRTVLTSLIARRTPDADATTFGLIAAGLVLAGCLSACGPGFRRPGTGEVRVLCFGLALFFVFFHAMQQWHPYGFRYFILAAPWMGVVGAWWLEDLDGWRRKIGWSVALLSAACVGGQTLARTHNAGWPAAVRPDNSIYSYVHRGWRGWLDQLDPHGQTLYVALPFNSELAPFYRRGHVRTQLVELKSLAGLSAEQAVARFPDGWLITTPSQFRGHEAGVVRRAWFFQGNAGSAYSVVAYRALHAGETPEIAAGGE
ncbi:MAG: hypothetical protein K0R17_2282 [Rariglobus sp.]|nr:hypothetical protein [Rariglobus sp.]